VATLVFGWCQNCICEFGYHLGTDEGECIYCKCSEYAEDVDTDLLDRLKGNLLPSLIAEAELEDPEQFEPEGVEHNTSIEIVEVIVHDNIAEDVVYNAVVFMGKASRSCKQCEELKLYKEFGNSDDPERLCIACREWAEQENVLGVLTDYERAEIESIESDIMEAEDEYEDIWERQRMMDEVLRELDE
jgi:hypothetical protein